MSRSLIIKEGVLINNLFAWAEKKRTYAEAGGEGSCYPSVRTAARTFKISQQEVIRLIEDAKGRDYPIDVIVGGGVNGGFFTYERIGDYLIETWDEGIAP